MWVFKTNDLKMAMVMSCLEDRVPQDPHSQPCNWHHLKCHTPDVYFRSWFTGYSLLPLVLSFSRAEAPLAIIFAFFSHMAEEWIFSVTSPMSFWKYMWWNRLGCAQALRQRVFVPDLIMFTERGSLSLEESRCIGEGMKFSQIRSSPSC